MSHDYDCTRCRHEAPGFACPLCGENAPVAIVPERLFPMQGGPSIPWSLAEDIYKAYAKLYGTRQSLEDLSKRGGFGWREVTVIGREYRHKYGNDPTGWSFC